MSSGFTRSGARRAGDDYQDLVAIEFLVEMLEHPNRYLWVQLEADDAGALDDIVALKSDGGIVACQVKFSTNPDKAGDEWTWDKLLHQPKGTSLLKKWAQSIEKVRGLGNLEKAYLYSNRRPSAELKAALDGDFRVGVERIENERVREDIINEIGSEDHARDFFDSFVFEVDRPGLEDLESTLRHRFSRLGGSDSGWAALTREVRHWVARKVEPEPDGKIRLSDVKSAAQWMQLNELPQRFEIPNDFIVPDTLFHEQFLANVTSSSSTCRVLCSGPGYGKSTYLSYLVDALQQQGFKVVRHHYFLSTVDRTLHRYDHRRVAESIMASLERELGNQLSDQLTGNPNPSQKLRTWLEVAGQHCQLKGQTLIVVIDGLDHVWRETASREELNLLFEHLLPCPEGVVIVVGTQPVDDKWLPLKLLSECPRSEWIELPRFSKEATRRWLELHENELHLHPPNRLYQLAELARALYGSSQGHPLHMHYTLSTLHAHLLPITHHTVSNLPAMSDGDISRYYDRLWITLPEPSREILVLMTATEFSWPAGGIHDCIGSTRGGPPAVNASLKEVQHLLVHDPLGLRIFHSSLLAYVQGHNDYHLYADRVQGEALAWLRSDAPEYWRWAYSWILAADLGDESCLLAGPTRAWLLDAISKRYPPREIQEILRRATWTALNRDHFTRFIELGLLLDYVVAYEDMRTRGGVTPFLAQLCGAVDEYFDARMMAAIEEMTVEELWLLARSQFFKGNEEFSNRCSEELSRRGADWNDEPRISREEWREHICALSAAAAYSDADPSRIVRFIQQFEERIEASLVAEAHSAQLRIAKRTNVFRSLLTSDLCTLAVSRIQRYAALHCLEEGISFASFGPHRVLNPVYAVCSHLQGGPLDISLVQAPAIYGGWSEYEWPDLRHHASEFFYDAFFALLLKHLVHDANELPPTPIQGADDWDRESIDLLDQAASLIADQVKAHAPISIGTLFRAFGDRYRPTMVADREHSDAAAGLVEALIQLSLDLPSLSSAYHVTSKITQADLTAALDTHYFDRWQFIERALLVRSPVLDTATADWLISQCVKMLETTADGFPDRANRYALLTAMASWFGVASSPDNLLQHTSENLIAYGYHKDLLLHFVLESIDACVNAGYGDPARWCIELAQAIAGIMEITDGDETSHLPSKLSAILGKVDTGLLSSYYLWLVENQDFDVAQDALESFVKSADLSAPISRAIAATGIDTQVYEALLTTRGLDDPSVRNVIDSIQEILGPFKPIEHDPASSNASRHTFEQPDPKAHPSDYPPPDVNSYVTEARFDYPKQYEQRVYEWLRFWLETDQRVQAFDAATDIIGTHPWVDVRDDIWIAARELYGRSTAFDWLVRAQRDANRWFFWATSREEAIGRWSMVRDDYPDRWREFLRHSLSAETGYRTVPVHGASSRIVEYCIFMHEEPVATQILDQLVQGVIDLVCAAPLPIPDWTKTR